MDEWISIEDELIIKSRNILRVNLAVLKNTEVRERTQDLYNELEDYIQANDLDFTKEKTDCL